MQPPATPACARRPRLLAIELWGIGDLALAVPFLRTAAARARVTLLAKPHAAPLVARFCPEVELVPFTAPWTAFTGKYALGDWPWLELVGLVRGLRHRRFDAAVTARPDPRDHALLALSGAALRAGFARAGSRALLTDPLGAPADPHRAAHWEALAGHFGWELEPAPPPPRPGRRVVIHPGAARPVREWPRARFEAVARRLAAEGWEVEMLDPDSRDLDGLLGRLDRADRFIGNDSGPGHLAALLGVPTFTVFGPQLPALFAPRHPQAGWVEGGPCPHKPCFDACRFPEPHCILGVDEGTVTARILAWLAGRALR
jgi:ADP-heptose:LPS heptosyltransferase